MLVALLLWSASVGQDDELLRVMVYPGVWAAAVQKFGGKPIHRRDVRSVGCVGLVYADVVCS